jgi:hypothetical protein
MVEAPVLRLRRGCLELRFKRAMVRVIVHNWFTLTFTATPAGGTIIAATEHLGLGRGWWMPGVSAGLFVAIAMGLSGAFWAGGILFATFGMQAMGFAFSAIATAVLTRGDRERLTSLLERVSERRGAA